MKPRGDHPRRSRRTPARLQHRPGLAEAANLLADLGATEAVNLDGGGSKTLVVSGQVLNRPSDRLVRESSGERVVVEPDGDDTVVGFVERPVANALAVVPTSPLSILGDLVGPVLQRPGANGPAPGPRDDSASRL